MAVLAVMRASVAATQARRLGFLPHRSRVDRGSEIRSLINCGSTDQRSLSWAVSGEPARRTSTSQRRRMTRSLWSIGTGLPGNRRTSIQLQHETLTFGAPAPMTSTSLPAMTTGAWVGCTIPQGMGHGPSFRMFRLPNGSKDFGAVMPHTSS